MGHSAGPRRRQLGLWAPTRHSLHVGQAAGGGRSHPWEDPPHAQACPRHAGASVVPSGPPTRATSSHLPTGAPSSWLFSLGTRCVDEELSQQPHPPDPRDVSTSIAPERPAVQGPLRLGRPPRPHVPTDVPHAHSPGPGVPWATPRLGLQFGPPGPGVQPPDGRCLANVGQRMDRSQVRGDPQSCSPHGRQVQKAPPGGHGTKPVRAPERPPLRPGPGRSALSEPGLRTGCAPASSPLPGPRLPCAQAHGDPKSRRRPQPPDAFLPPAPPHDENTKPASIQLREVLLVPSRSRHPPWPRSAPTGPSPVDPLMTGGTTRRGALGGKLRSSWGQGGRDCPPPETRPARGRLHSPKRLNLTLVQL